MGSDASEDGDPTQPGLRSESSAAFAVTVAPETPSEPPTEPRINPIAPTQTPTPPPVLPAGTTSGAVTRPRTWKELESDATIDAPTSADAASPEYRAPARDSGTGERGTRGIRSAGDAPALPVVSAAHYRADREIARGGMGRIVAAEDQRLRRPVALKELLEPAPEQLGRFQREALITARLQHPGIVPVYEAGRWPSGEPFFAMKLVSGRPLDRVIAEAATLEDRLALLPRIAAAADAIAYAHSQRVIHRDLKPANILIGEFGETVVIDSGLAKNLDEAEPPEAERRAAKPAPRAAPTASDATRKVEQAASTLTVAGAVMGTPAYMAPEQARGEPVDQRADVFALGAMLYHLLAGVPPYNARTATDVIAAAAAGKVVPLTHRERGAPPDLVAIVTRAMSPLPIDRYGDAGELASELRRFLTGQLVSAHRYTAAERVGRFVKRHRAAVTIAVLAAIGFAAGGTFAVRRILHERDLADRERRLADIRRQAAEHLIDKMLSDVKSRLQQIGRLDLLASLGSEIRDYYGTLAKIPGGMPADDIDRMAIAVDLIGVAERDSGKLDEAFVTWSGARATLARAAGTGETMRFKRRMIARLDFELGTIHQQRGNMPAALAAYTQAKQEFEALRNELPTDRSVLLGAAETRDRIGDILRNGGRVDEAFDEYAEAKADRERAASSPSSRPQDEVLALSTSHLKLGAVFQVRGESAKALEEYRIALRLRQTLLDGQHDNVEIQNTVLDVQLTLGDLQRTVGDPDSAIETYGKALPVMDALTRRDPANTTWRRLRGNLEADYGFALLDRGDYRAGLEQLERALATQHELVDLDPKSTVWQGDLSRSYTRAGDAQLYLGDIDGCIARYRLGLEIRRKLVAKEPRSAPYRRSVGWSHAKLAGAYTTRNDAAHALEASEEALELRARLAEEFPAQSGFRNELALGELALGRLIAARDAERSARLIESGLARARALVAADPINHEWKETLTQGLLARADAARAAGSRKLRDDALAEALELARAAMAGPAHNVRWPGLAAEIHAGLAEQAAARGDARAARAAWQAVREALEPLERAGRLAVQRKPLLERARTGR